MEVYSRVSLMFSLYSLQEVQILKALVLGEEERGQSQYQVMCFVCHFNRDDFISSDAMSKLRQVRTLDCEKPQSSYYSPAYFV